jgi:hypothetical protein
VAAVHGLMVHHQEMEEVVVQAAAVHILAVPEVPQHQVKEMQAVQVQVFQVQAKLQAVAEVVPEVPEHLHYLLLHPVL